MHKIEKPLIAEGGYRAKRLLKFRTYLTGSSWPQLSTNPLIGHAWFIGELDPVVLINFCDPCSMPPSGIRSPEWRTPIRQTIVTDLDLSLAAAVRETSITQSR